MAAGRATTSNPACARSRSNIPPSDRVRIVNIFHGGQDFESFYLGFPDEDE